MKRLRVRDRVMTSHDSCTIGTFRVLTVASLQRLKLEVLIPTPADCEVSSVIKFLNSQSTASIEIRQLWQAYGYTRLDDQWISYRSSIGRCLIIIHPIARTSRPMISIFFYPSKNSCPVSVSVFRMTGADACHDGSNLRRQTCTTHDTKVGPTIWKMCQFRRLICWKIAQHFLYLFQ